MYFLVNTSPPELLDKETSNLAGESWPYDVERTEQHLV